MGKQGKPMLPEERLRIIQLRTEEVCLEEIKEKTGFSKTAIKNTIEEYENGRIDAKGYKKGAKIGENSGEFKKTVNPIEFIKND